MKCSLALLILTSSFFGENTALGFSATTTKENVFTFGKVTEKRARLVEPATQEQRNSAGNSVFWKSFVENLKEAEKLVKDPSIFKQEEAVVAPLGETPSIHEVPATSSAIPAKTKTRFILEADEQLVTLKRRKTTSIPQANTNPVLYYPVVLVDQNSPLAKRRPIIKFPAIVPAQPSKMSSRAEFLSTYSVAGDKVVYITAQPTAVGEEQKALTEIESLDKQNVVVDEAEEVEDDLALNLPATYIPEYPLYAFA